MIMIMTMMILILLVIMIFMNNHIIPFYSFQTEAPETEIPSLAFDMTNLLLVQNGSWTWVKKSLGSEAQITHEAHHIPTPLSQPHFAGWRGISLIPAKCYFHVCHKNCFRICTYIDIICIYIYIRVYMSVWCMCVCVCIHKCMSNEMWEKG